LHPFPTRRSSDLQTFLKGQPQFLRIPKRSWACRIRHWYYNISICYWEFLGKKLPDPLPCRVNVNSFHYARRMREIGILKGTVRVWLFVCKLLRVDATLAHLYQLTGFHIADELCPDCRQRA